MSEALQRWRIVFARDEEARYLAHLDAVTQWERAFRRGAIPIATTGGFSARPKLVFAAPLQLGMLAEHELVDLFLAERLTAPALRRRLSGGMPAGYRVIDLHDVWMGAPALAPQLVAADYRMTLFGAERKDLESAAVRLMYREELTRERRRESKTVTYDLRPLIIDLRVRDTDPAALAAAGVPDGVSTRAAELWMRLRHSQERGSGRADEVVAALADELDLRAAGVASDENAIQASTDRASDVGGAAEAPDAGGPAIECVLSIRERLWLAEELAERQTSGGPRSPPPTPARSESGSATEVSAVPGELRAF
jgi:radical SAM-linked protein